MRFHVPDRVGQRRFCDLNVWSEKKQWEKLNDMRGDAVRNGAGQWYWLATCH